MQTVALFCLFAAAALAQDVPKEAAPTDSLTMAQRKEAIDQAAQKADMAADSAMAEAEKEEAEEKSIEASVGELVSDIGETGPQVSKMKEADEEVQSKEVARARLKKAMEAKLEQKNEAQQRIVALKAAKLKVLENEKAAQHRAELKAAKLKALEHEKSVQLATLEHEQMEVKRKLAKLEKEKSEEEARLKQAEKLKKDESKLAKDVQVPSLDGFVRKAVLKKYGNRFPTQALERAAERKMKQLVEARLKKQKAIPHMKQAEAPKLDLDALVKKAEDSHIKKTGKRFSKAAEVRLKIAFDKKLHVAVAKRMQKKATVAPAANANTLVNIKESTSLHEKTSAAGAADDSAAAADDAEAASAATEDTEQEGGKDDSEKTDDGEHDIVDEVSDDDTQKTDDSQKGASEDKSENADDSHNTEQSEEEIGSGETQQEDTGSEETQQEAFSKDESNLEAESQVSAEDDSGSAADTQDSTEDTESDSTNPASDMDDDEVAEAEVFLQKGKALRSPMLFSTEDTDLQPYLHPKILAPRVLAARRSLRQHKQLQRRKHDTRELDEASQALEQFKQKLKREERNVGAPAPGTAGAPGPAPAPAVKIDPYEMCKDLCKFDTGMDGDFDSCNTDCRTYVDAGGDLNSLKDFVTDETYNKQGGETMEKHFEEKTGEDIPDCKPTLELDPNIEFDKVDFNSDGKLTRDEMNMWGEKACVPSELANQIMDAADADNNDEVTPAEYNALGEDTGLEDTIDEFADKTTEGEDQYEPVQLPAFRHVDSNSDGQLDQDEVMKIFKEEIKKRIPTMDEASVNEMAAEHQQELLKDMDKVDKNADGFINEEEYGAMHSGGMGTELSEAAAADNNLPDPDDLKREYLAGHEEYRAAPSPAGAAAAPTPAAASAFLSREA